MLQLQPVDHDPFERLVPVDYDPFLGVPAPSDAAQAKFNKIVDAVLGGLRNTVEFPGHYMQSGINRDAAADWAAPTAFGMMGVGAPNAMAGAVGIFGGKLAATADKVALAKAEQLAAKGATREDIWNQTGWFKGPDDKWRFEIPDDNLSVRKGYGAGLEYGSGYAWGRSNYPKIEHPDLTAAYPGKFDYLAHDVKIERGAEPSGRFMPEGAGRNEEFYYHDKPVLPALFIDAPTTKQARSIGSHELQHAVQGEEGFATGSNPTLSASAIYKDINPRLSELAKQMDKASPEQRVALKAEYDELLSKKLEANPYDLYRRAMGEVEARNVQARLDMTPEQRRAAPPWATQDVPDAQQVVPPRNSIYSLVPIDHDPFAPAGVAQ